jgi:hypothetical protein
MKKQVRLFKGEGQMGHGYSHASEKQSHKNCTEAFAINWNTSWRLVNC